jgi:hypothetical protein
MPNKLSGTSIQSGTITSTQLSATLITTIESGGGPKIASIIYPGNDLAANTVGGQTLYITGSGFKSNSTVYINGNNVPSVSYISASNLSFTSPALSSASYPVYVINPEDGATAILIPGLQISGEPSWVTGATLTEQDATGVWNISLSATGDAPLTYALAAGSSLPTGISLASNGVISGTITTPPEADTTYNFTAVATDAQNQDSSRAFSVTATTGEGALFANNVLLIHANGTNNKNNHAFLDSSTNNFSITRNGNATQGSFSPFSQTGWSNYFDGNGDYLSVSANAGFDLVTGNFTVESWIYDQGPGAERYIFSNRPVNAGWEFRKNATNLLQFFFTSGSSITSTSTITPNVWTHVAVTRESSTVRIFINGNLDASASFSDGISGVSSALFLGYGTTGGGYFLGYMSNARIVKGTALYTSNFTPSTSPLTAVSGTSLLTCQSNRFKDNSTNNFTITRNGDTSVQSFSPFAPTAAYSTANVGGSAYFDGTGDYLTLPSSSNLAFGTGDFSVEMWVYFTGSPTGDQLLTNISGSETEFSFRIDASNYPKVQSWFTNYAISNTAVTSDQWYHLVACRASNTLSLFVNGKKTANATVTNNFSSTNAMTIGGTSGSEFCGYISSMRITKGSSPYDPTLSTLTVPTAPLTNIANTSFLCNYTNAGIFDQTAKTVLETVGDAKVSTAQYKYGTGSMYFDGTGDYLQVRNASPLFNFGTGNFTVEFWMYPVASTGDNGMYDSRVVDLNATGFTISLTDAEKIQFYSDTQKILGTTTVSLNTWTHIAVTRSGTSLRLFVNGVLDGNVSNSQNFTDTNITIGRGVWASSEFEGYLDDFRVTKGYARYTSNFSPPTSALKDK